jgi:hypothetical protein
MLNYKQEDQIYTQIYAATKILEKRLTDLEAIFIKSQDMVVRQLSFIHDFMENSQSKAIVKEKKEPKKSTRLSKEDFFAALKNSFGQDQFNSLEAYKVIFVTLKEKKLPPLTESAVAQRLAKASKKGKFLKPSATRYVVNY